jgi:hypothetical protein
MTKVAAIVVLMFVCGCSVETGAPVPPAPPKPVPVYDQAGSCVDAFSAALDAYETVRGPVAEECTTIDRHYKVTITTPAELEVFCGKGRLACMVPGSKTHGSIWIRQRDPEREMWETAIHEWIHAISYCDTGDGQATHDAEELYGSGLASGFGELVPGTAVYLAIDAMKDHPGYCLEEEQW